MGAQFIVWLVFGVLGAAAAAFVAWPIWRNAPSRARAVLMCAAIALELAIGGGFYLALGSPWLAQRSFATPQMSDLPALVAALARRAPHGSLDARGWTLLGRGYLAFGDATDAAAAFRRGAEIAKPAQRGELLSLYGETLIEATQDAASPEAEVAFKAAVAADPKGFRPRYDLGLAYALRNDTADALAQWQSLLADAPAGAPWRGPLIARMAALSGSAAGAPGIEAMVAGLAARLAAHSQDAPGWQRLIKSYVVLGEDTKAKDSLARARKALSADHAALAALAVQAKVLKLEK